MKSTDQNTTKTRYSDEELKEFDQLLDEKLEKARDQLAYYEGLLEDFANNSDAKVKGLDDGASTQETESIARMAGRTRKHIEHLQNAKIRIKNKVYGVCRETGKLISKDRLRAVPHATLSIDAKNARK